MEILNELKKMISSIDCMIERFEKVDIEDEIDVESALTLFSTAVKHNVILKEFIAYSKDHKDDILNLALSCLTVVNNAYESLDNPNQETRQKFIDIINMSLMMSKTYLYLYKYILTQSW